MPGSGNRAIFLALTVCFLAACDQAGLQNDHAQLHVDGIIASRVNGEPIYLSDVEVEAATQGLIAPGETMGIGHPEYQEVLDQLVDQRLLAQEAVAKGLHLDTTARRRLDSARERVLGNILVENLVATSVSEARIREMYSQQVNLQQLDDQVRLRHILLETEDEANDVHARILAGEDFTTLAFETSTDVATRLEGGELGYLEPVRLGEPFASVIGNTSVGEASEPFLSEQGWHIIKVEDRRTPPPKTLDEMRPEIITFLTYEEISLILNTLREEAIIEAGPDVPRITISPDTPDEDSL